MIENVFWNFVSMFKWAPEKANKKKKRITCHWFKNVLTYPIDIQHTEWAATWTFHDNSQKLWVDTAKVAVMCISCDSNILKYFLPFTFFAKYMAKFRKTYTKWHFCIFLQFKMETWKKRGLLILLFNFYIFPWNMTHVSHYLHSW